METTNLSLAFIVRAAAIDAAALSQNATPHPRHAFNTRKLPSHHVMGPSLEPAFGVVEGGVHDLEAETEEEAVEDGVGEVADSRESYRR